MRIENLGYTIDFPYRFHGLASLLLDMCRLHCAVTWMGTEETYE